MRNKFKQGMVAILVLVLVAVGWQFGLRPRLQRFQAWEGTIADTYKVHDAERVTADPHRAEHLEYRHYLRVDLDGGGEEDIEVPHRIWTRARPGLRVVKESGELYPEFVAQEDASEANAATEE